jgi:hypothetical protein
MKKIIAVFVGALLLSSSCKEALEINPKGLLNKDQISTKEDAEKFVVSAYSQLGNDDIILANSLWPHGNVRAGDAYKGGRDPGDVWEYGAFETYKDIRPEMGPIDGMWFSRYVGIRRTNIALELLNKFTEEEYPNLNVRKAEMRFLRAHNYFNLKILFKQVPYVDETTPYDDYDKITNVALTSDQLWEKIAEDFAFAAANLPATQPEKGRANQFAAYAYLAKTRLYQAYEQNDQHQVVNINQERLQQVIEAADKVINSGQYSLQPDFANNFLTQFDNGVESVFAVQFSKDDGAGTGRVNFGDRLTTPQGLGCCDFQKPTYNLVNAFKTNELGQPLFESYNETHFDSTYAGTVDPRLDHTVARVGNPWKYDASRIFTKEWSRTPSIYGYFNSLKEAVAEGYVQDGPFFGNTKTRMVIRYADVLLFKAEALIELGRQDEALPIINQLRERAAASTGRLKNKEGELLANYHVQPYATGMSQEEARKVLRWERRLEMALEGGRFFDLVRWGIADEEMNAYLAKEKTRREHLKDGKFTEGRDEYLPIPQAQINFSGGIYEQNEGYQ